MSSVYLVYKVVNKLTERYYIGVHKTNDPNDGYLGSGLVIRRAIRKYGADNFSKEVLAVFNTAKEAMERERDVISVCMDDSKCYNLHEGGLGGFDQINAKGLNNKNDNYRAANESRIYKIKTDPEFRKKFQEGGRKGIEKAKLNPKWGSSEKSRILATLAWTGSSHSVESRKKMSDCKRGELNQWYGMKWMKNENGYSERVKSYDIPNRLQSGWSLGRKIKFDEDSKP